MYKIFHLRNDFYILLYKATKWLSRIKIINFHHQWSLPYPTPSASSFKSIFIFRTLTPTIIPNHKWYYNPKLYRYLIVSITIMMSLIKVEKQETAPPIFHIIISWENDIWIIGTWHGRWQRPLLWEKKQGEVLFVFCMFFILLLRDFSDGL